MNQSIIGDEKAYGLPWGFWLTITFSLAIFMASSFGQGLVAAAYIILTKIHNPDINIFEFGKELEQNGLYLSVTTLIAAPLYIGLCSLFAKIRNTMPIRAYLGLYACGWKTMIKWITIVIFVMIGSDTLTHLWDKDIVPPFMINIFETAGSVPLLLFVVIIVAPVVEELFFRGFMFKGLQYSKAGPVGAVILTSLLWSGIHLQYDFYQIAVLFIGGLVLGWARYKTGSIIPCMAMHMSLNVLSTVELVIYLNFFR